MRKSLWERVACTQKSSVSGGLASLRQVLPYSSGCLGIHYIEKANLELTGIRLSSAGFKGMCTMASALSFK